MASGSIRIYRVISEEGAVVKSKGDNKLSTLKYNSYVQGYKLGKCEKGLRICIEDKAGEVGAWVRNDALLPVKNAYLVVDEINLPEKTLKVGTYVVPAPLQGELGKVVEDQSVPETSSRRRKRSNNKYSKAVANLTAKVNAAKLETANILSIEWPVQADIPVRNLKKVLLTTECEVGSELKSEVNLMLHRTSSNARLPRNLRNITRKRTSAGHRASSLERTKISSSESENSSDEERLSVKKAGEKSIEEERTFSKELSISLDGMKLDHDKLERIASSPPATGSPVAALKQHSGPTKFKEKDMADMSPLERLAFMRKSLRSNSPKQPVKERKRTSLFTLGVRKKEETQSTPIIENDTLSPRDQKEVTRGNTISLSIPTNSEAELATRDRAKTEGAERKMKDKKQAKLLAMFEKKDSEATDQEKALHNRSSRGRTNHNHKRNSSIEPRSTSAEPGRRNANQQRVYRCPECDDKIYRHELTEVRGRVKYHQKCYKMMLHKNTMEERMKYKKNEGRGESCADTSHLDQEKSKEFWSEMFKNNTAKLVTICPECLQPIYMGERGRTYKGKYYHKGCIKCTKCKRSFRQNEAWWTGKDKEGKTCPWCERCWREVFTEEFGKLKDVDKEDGFMTKQAVMVEEDKRLNDMFDAVQHRWINFVTFDIQEQRYINPHFIEAHGGDVRYVGENFELGNLIEEPKKLSRQELFMPTSHAEYHDFKTALTETAPSLGFITLTYKLQGDIRTKDTTTLVFWNPEDAPKTERVLYGTAKGILNRNYPCHAIEARSLDELGFGNLLKVIGGRLPNSTL